MRLFGHACVLSPICVFGLAVTGEAAFAGFTLPETTLELFDDDYRIGDEWGKKAVTADDLAADPALARAAKATAKISGATSFYLGEFAGKHVLATNHHVCPSRFSCEGSTVSFTQLGVRARVATWLGSWSDVDLSLLVLEAPVAADAAKLQEVAANFAFDDALYSGRPLTTVGYGWADNPGSVMMANRDSDCVVFSGDAEYRFMADPDAFNPADYMAWSFANGCDVSHGDSGSAMVDRETGAVLGIIWTGKIPKDQSVQDSAYLQGLLGTGDAAIWSELSYAVPAAKIKEQLQKIVDDGATATSTKDIVTAILAN